MNRAIHSVNPSCPNRWEISPTMNLEVYGSIAASPPEAEGTNDATDSVLFDFLAKWNRTSTATGGKELGLLLRGSEYILLSTTYCNAGCLPILR